MIIFLKRVNIIIALILLFLTLGLIKFKNNLSHGSVSNFNVDAVVVLTGGKVRELLRAINKLKNLIKISCLFLVLIIPLIQKLY